MHKDLFRAFLENQPQRNHIAECFTYLDERYTVVTWFGEDGQSHLGGLFVEHGGNPNLYHRRENAENLLRLIGVDPTIASSLVFDFHTPTSSYLVPWAAFAEELDVDVLACLVTEAGLLHAELLEEASDA